MENFYEYLMLEMAGQINEEWDHEYHRAHELCFLLSLDGHPVPETFFRMYSSNVECDMAIIENALAFFSGLGLLSVPCDCASGDKVICEYHLIEESPFFLRGKKSLEENSLLCKNLTARLASIREDFNS